MVSDSCEIFSSFFLQIGKVHDIFSVCVTHPGLFFAGWKNA